MDINFHDHAPPPVLDDYSQHPSGLTKNGRYWNQVVLLECLERDMKRLQEVNSPDEFDKTDAWVNDIERRIVDMRRIIKNYRRIKV